MELEDEDGSRIALQDGQKTVFGRGLGFHTDDRTVSRRHVLLGAETSEDKSGSQTRPKVSFEVVGKNPIWVRESGGGEIRVFRRGEKGDAAPGDWLCFSGRTPAWFTVRGSGFGEGEKRVLGSENGLDANLRGGFEFDGVDVSEIDPVKEFGFLVMGHEFDHYPKQMICDIKNWDWFLEERRRDSDDDDDDEYREKQGKRVLMRKRRKAEGDDDDDDWTSESGDDKELVAKLRKVEKPKYSTRSKDFDKLDKEAKARKNSSQKKTRGANQEYVENKNENDETLGGFIVVDDDVEQGEEIDEDEEEEEEEFIEDDDDDEEELDD